MIVFHAHISYTNLTQEDAPLDNVCPKYTQLFMQEIIGSVNSVPPFDFHVMTRVSSCFI